MNVPFVDIESAFFYVSMDQKHINRALLCKQTGETYFISELGDSDELPEDIDDPEKYIAIPHKSDLHLGKDLVIEFASSFLPQDVNKVEEIFSRRGAYARFKDLLQNRGMLNDWYEFENERVKKALKEWCWENDIHVQDELH